jgi:hypothetical protein
VDDASAPAWGAGAAASAVVAPEVKVRRRSRRP